LSKKQLLFHTTGISTNRLSDHVAEFGEDKGYGCQPKEICQHLRAYSNAIHEGVGVTDPAQLATVIRGESEYFHLKFTELVPVTAKQALVTLV